MCFDIYAGRQQVILEALWALQLPLHVIMSGYRERNGARGKRLIKKHEWNWAYKCGHQVYEHNYMNKERKKNVWLWLTEWIRDWKLQLLLCIFAHITPWLLQVWDSETKETLSLFDTLAVKTDTSHPIRAEAPDDDPEDPRGLRNCITYN